MSEPKGIVLFEKKHVRRVWDAEAEKWQFSVVDVVSVLTDSNTPRRYWNDLKRKLRAEGSQLSENIGQLKMEAADGKKYLTDVADAEQVLRLVQSIPSKKAEPFKLWLAKVGHERMQEIENPELAAKRMHDIYLEKGIIYTPWGCAGVRF